MKLRTDLLKKLTADDILEEAAVNQHRYKAEPTFSKTGTGYLFEFLRSCHKRAPFLFFNGNTFAEIGRALANALFNDLPYMRKKEVASAVAHFITGVLDRDSMASIISSCARTAQLLPGDRVRTLRGTLRGVIVRVLEDGRVAWRPDSGVTELIALPETLAPE